jgi:protein-tyrosine phosphatase
LNGNLIGSEHPENLRREPSEKLDVTQRIARRLVESHRVRTVLNLTEHPWSYGLSELRVVHLPMSDRDIRATSHETLTLATRVIDEAITAGQAAWVHCQGGIDRTGCVVACHLVSSGQTLDTAIAAVKECWPERRRNNSHSHELWEPVAERIREYAAALRPASHR